MTTPPPQSHLPAGLTRLTHLPATWPLVLSSSHPPGPAQSSPCPPETLSPQVCQELSPSCWVLTLVALASPQLFSGSQRASHCVLL